MGIPNKGGIVTGKDADLVIWDPFQKFTVNSEDIAYSDMSPLIGEELYGVILRTYIRGKLAYNQCTNSTQAIGEVLSKN